MRRTRNLILLMWLNLIQWCRYNLLFQLDFMYHIFILFLIYKNHLYYSWLGSDNESWDSWFRILFKGKYLPSFRWIQVSFTGRCYILEYSLQYEKHIIFILLWKFEIFYFFNFEKNICSKIWCIIIYLLYCQIMIQTTWFIIIYF